jgi:hypothetical protein
MDRYQFGRVGSRYQEPRATWKEGVRDAILFESIWLFLCELHVGEAAPVVDLELYCGRLPELAIKISAAFHDEPPFA